MKLYTQIVVELGFPPNYTDSQSKKKWIKNMRALHHIHPAWIGPFEYYLGRCIYCKEDTVGF